MPSATAGLRHAALLALPIGLVACGDASHYCGNCTYVPPTEVSYGLVAGDFTGNGYTSVVTTSTVLSGPGPYPGNLKTYLSTGAGSFAAPALISDGDNPLYLASADLNGDGTLDVVSASSEDGTLTVFFNNPSSKGSFNTPVVLSSPGASQLAIGDMNGDGLLDLVSADYNVSLFMQTAPGTFAAPIPLYTGGANWVAVGDLNGDGAPDVALTDDVGVKVLFHTGAAGTTTYGAPVSVYTENVGYPAGANLIAIADVNGDGLNDLVITDPGPPDGSAPFIEVLLQNAAAPGTFLPPVSYPTAPGAQAESIVVTDVNGDGKPDIIIGGTSAVSVLLQDPTAAGTFQAAASYPVGGASEIAVADVNGDGLPDIIVSTGVSHPLVNGVVTNGPGVLLQVASAPGTFAPVTDLP